MQECWARPLRFGQRETCPVTAFSLPIHVQCLLLSDLCLPCWCLLRTTHPQKCVQEECHQGGARCTSHAGEGQGWPGGLQGAFPAEPVSGALDPVSGAPDPVSAQHRSTGSPCVPLTSPQATILASLGQSSHLGLDRDPDFLAWQKKCRMLHGTV